MTGDSDPDSSNGGETSRTGRSGGDALDSETTQNSTDLLAFLRADPLDIYNALSGDALAYVEARRGRLLPPDVRFAGPVGLLHVER